jgi:hypothetical protein
MNNGINKNLNCRYGADFTRKLINEDIFDAGDQKQFWIKDTLFFFTFIFPECS